MGWFEDRFIESENKHLYACVTCNKPMFFPKSKVGKYITCNKECAIKFRLKNKEQRKRICATCGKEFFPRNTQIQAGHGNVCSQKCNVKTHLLLNSKESRIKSKQSWKKTFLKQNFFKKGPEHHAWKGGPKASYERYIKSGKGKAYWAVRRFNGQGKKISKDIVNFLGEKQQWKCIVCRQKLVEYEVDHIVPLKLNGKDNIENLQLLCKRDNRRKSAKDPIKFMQANGFLL